MKKHRKQRFACMLCLFFVFSVFGGGLSASATSRAEADGALTDAQIAANENLQDPNDNPENEEDSETAGDDTDEAVADENDTESESLDSSAQNGGVTENDPEEQDKPVSSKTKKSVMKAAAAYTGETFTVTGGVEGTDYRYEEISYTNQGYGRATTGTMASTEEYTPPKSGVSTWTQNSLVIMTSKPMTISSTGTTHAGIYIEPGVQADLTFANVNIEAKIPVNIVTNHDASKPGTSLHLTLADNSENTLNCEQTGNVAIQAAGIRCGEGSSLTIDDARRNIDTNGQFVAPKDGVVSRDATLSDGTKVKAGDSLSVLESPNRGTLTVNGGYRGAGIGGGPLENSGILTFNGGHVIVKAFGEVDWNTMGAGAGIGGGHAGGGTTININGGEIDAKGSYHGAGIGGGCTYIGGMDGQVTYVFEDAVLAKTPFGSIAGDININGGFIKSVGCDHSNAFGEGCGGTNYGKTIKITGGTLLPTSKNGTDAAGRPLYDIGGVGGDVIVTGGSIRLTDNNPNKFQCNGGTAYGDDEKETRVFMTTINLSAEKIDGQNIYNHAITGWKLLIGGKEYPYGSPSYFDEGKLYLWLPSSADGQEVTVILSAVKEDGTAVEMEPLFIDKAEQGQNPLLKRYVNFILPDEYNLENLSKDYDGVAFDALDISKIKNVVQETDEQGNVISEKTYYGIYTGEVDNKYLNVPAKVNYKVQRYDEVNGTPIEQEIQLGSQMPVDAGILKFTMTSTQYSGEVGFSESYWGHRATGWAIINKIPAELTDAYYDIKYGQVPSTEDPDVMETVVTEMTFRAAVKQGEEKRKETCAAPDGYVQFYVNGVKVGAPVAVTASKDKEDGKYAYSTANVTIDFSNDATSPAIPRLDSGEFIVNAVYYDGTNYLGDETPVKPEPKQEGGGETPDEPENFPYINPPIPVISASGDKPSGDEEPKGTKLNPEDIERIEDKGDLLRLHGQVSDKISRKVEKDKVLSGADLVAELNERYVFVGLDGKVLTDKNGDPIAIENVTIKNSNGDEISEIDLSEAGKYTLETTVTDAKGNKTTITVAYTVNKSVILNSDLNKDIDGDGIPDINIDKDDDGVADVNIDTDGDDKPDINIDKDGDGEPDVNVDTDGDGKPDINKDTDGDGKPDLDIDTNGDGKPDVNVDTDGDGKPDINKDTDGDGKPDVDIDTDGDGKPDVNVDTDGDGKPDINKDTDGDGKPDVDIDTDGDGKPDINKDTDGDGKPDVDIDTDGDGKPDINKDTDGDGKPDVDIDTDGDGKPDVNVDTDGDGIPDLNIDTDGDGIPDLNIDTDGDGKPDINIDTNNDGKADKNIDKDYKSKYDKDNAAWRYPRTGDGSSLVLWLSLMGATALALGACVLLHVKRKSLNR